MNTQPPIPLHVPNMWEDVQGRLHTLEKDTTEIKLTLRSMNIMLMKIDSMMFGNEENDMQGIFERIRIAERRLKIIFSSVYAVLSAAVASGIGILIYKLTGEKS